MYASGLIGLAEWAVNPSIAIEVNSSYIAYSIGLEYNLGRRWPPRRHSLDQLREGRLRFLHSWIAYPRGRNRHQ